MAGITDGRQYSIQPSVFVPYLTWDDIKPKATLDNMPSTPIFNLMAVQLENPQDFELMVSRLEKQVGQVEAGGRSGDGVQIHTWLHGPAKYS